LPLKVDAWLSSHGNAPRGRFLDKRPTPTAVVGRCAGRGRVSTLSSMRPPRRGARSPAAFLRLPVFGGVYLFLQLAMLALVKLILARALSARRRGARARAAPRPPAGLKGSGQREGIQDFPPRWKNRGEGPPVSRRAHSPEAYLERSPPTWGVENAAQSTDT
jgi:hypothetical protein